MAALTKAISRHTAYAFDRSTADSDRSIKPVFGEEKLVSAGGDLGEGRLMYGFIFIGE